MPAVKGVRGLYIPDRPAPLGGSAEHIRSLRSGAKAARELGHHARANDMEAQATYYEKNPVLSRPAHEEHHHGGGTTGPKGGVYHLSESGQKVYEKK